MSRLALFFTSSSGLPSLNARSLSFPALFLQRNIGVTRHKKKPGVVFLYACSSRRCQVTRGVGGLFPPEGRLWASLWTCEREGSCYSCGAHNFDALLHWCGNEIFASTPPLLLLYRKGQVQRCTFVVFAGPFSFVISFRLRSAPTTVPTENETWGRNAKKLAGLLH